MIKKLNIGLIFFLFLVFSKTSFAQDDEERPYDASVSLGYVGTSGNTEITTLNTEFLLTFLMKNGRIILNLMPYLRVKMVQEKPNVIL